MLKSDRERLKKMVFLWERLTAQIDGHQITKESLMTDEFAQWAVTTPLYNIGEQVYRISSDFKEAHPELPWAVVSGLRHRLVHDYEGINWSVIVEVVFDEMEPFISAVRTLI